MIDYNTFLEGLQEYRKRSADNFSSIADDIVSTTAMAHYNLEKNEQQQQFGRSVETATTSLPDVGHSQIVNTIGIGNQNKPAIVEIGCAFCISNKERPAVYKSHSIKDEQGRVTCPILRAYVCPLCSATGDNAHTIRYCQRTAVGTKTSGFLRTARNSAGRVIRQQKL